MPVTSTQPIPVITSTEDSTFESLVKSALEIVQPKRVFAWGLSRAVQYIANYPTVQSVTVVTASEEAARRVSEPGYELPKNTEVVVKNFLEAYHVPTVKLGQGMYDMVLVQEEFERDATGRDWKRIRAREAFTRAIYNAKGVTRNDSVVLVRSVRGWDTKTNKELWRWSANEKVGECAVLGQDMQLVKRVVNKSKESI